MFKHLLFLWPQEPAACLFELCAFSMELGSDPLMDDMEVCHFCAFCLLRAQQGVMVEMRLGQRTKEALNTRL